MTSFSLFTLSFNHVPTLEQEHFFAQKFVKMLSRKERKRLTATRAYAHGSQLRLSPLAPASALPLLTHPAYTRIQMRCPTAMPRAARRAPQWSLWPTALYVHSKGINIRRRRTRRVARVFVESDGSRKMEQARRVCTMSM